jgi:signal transduction histidine kinase
LVISKHWDGLCQTEFNIAAGLEGLANKAASDVAAVVEEALTNAVRHGQATRVDIGVEDLGESIGVTASDNGLGLSDGTPGLGTELIRLISSDNFSLTANPGGGASLRVFVPKAG